MALWGWMAYVICEDGNGFSLSRAFQHYYLHAWHTLCCQACQRHRKVGIKSHKWYMNSKRLCGFGLVLTPRERHAIIQKLQNDVGAKSEPTHFHGSNLELDAQIGKFWPTPWCIYADRFLCKTFINICFYLIWRYWWSSWFLYRYSLSLFLPSIIKGMGFQDLEAQAMSAPPYAIGKSTSSHCCYVYTQDLANQVML